MQNYDSEVRLVQLSSRGCGGGNGSIEGQDEKLFRRKRIKKNGERKDKIVVDVHIPQISIALKLEKTELSRVWEEDQSEKEETPQDIGSKQEKVTFSDTPQIADKFDVN